VGIPTSAQ
jgi:tetratricopeptide (TPR) repeat protein